MQIVSIHAPVKGATTANMGGTPGNRFNPRTRERCDDVVEISNEPLDVSIHAPVKGATRLVGLSAMREQVSIHAPVKGATHQSRHRYSRHRSFNPRTRERCDHTLLLTTHKTH